MQLQVLGPLSAEEGGQVIDLGSRMQRLVLALLCSQPGEVFTTDGLLDAMWGASPPASARKAVQGYVSNLRKLLGSEMIRTEPTGYRLVIEDGVLDAARFRGSLRDAAAESNPQIRQAVLRAAIDAWKGRPYEDLDDVESLATEIDRLNELRTSAIEESIDLALSFGDAERVLVDAHDLATSNPYRERAWELHMRALHAVGRRREALQAYEQLRLRLAEEVGVEPSAALRDLETQMLNQAVELEPALKHRAPVDNPYRGLRPFDEDSSGSFFGRDRLVRRLREHLDQPRELRLTLVVGASGIGKSSVVRAGLVPLLRREGRTTEIVELLGSNGWSRSVASSVDVLVLDQLESTLADPDSAADVLASIHELATGSPRCSVVATLRADYLDVVLSDQLLGPHVEQSIVLVPPMSDQELVAAIERPAASAGCTVEPALTEHLVAEMRDRTASLPLMQYALTETFDQSNGSVLTRQDFTMVGGIGAALARRAESLLEPLTDQRRDEVRAALLRLVAIGSDSRPTLRTRAMGDFGPGQRAVLEVFGAHRMVTFDRGREPSVTISHEALLRDWPRLAGWIDEARSDLQALRRLSEATAAWEDEGRPEELLFGQQVLSRYDNALVGQAEAGEQAFLDRSRLAVERGRRRRSLSIAAVGAMLVGAAAVALVFALIARDDRKEAEAQRIDAEEQQAIAEEQQAVAEALRVAADEQRELAERRSLETEALLQGQTDPELGLLLAAEAAALDDSAAAVGPLLTSIGRFPSSTAVIDDYVHPGIGLVSGVRGERSDGGSIEVFFRCATSPRPGLFVSAAIGGTLAFVDAAQGSGRIVDSVPACLLSVDPEVQRVVQQASLTGGSRIIDLATGEQVVANPDAHNPTWLPDGRILAFASTSPEGRVDDGDQSEPAGLLVLDDDLQLIETLDLTAVAVYPDPVGSLLLISDAVTRTDGSPDLTRVHRTLIDLETFEVVHDLGVVERTPTSVTWSPDGTLFGDIDSSGVLRVWDARSGVVVTEQSLGVEQREGWIAFDPTNQQLAIVGRSAGVSIRPLENPGRVSLQVPRAAEPQVPVEIMASYLDSETLAVLRDDGAVVVYSLRTSSIVTETIDHDRPVAVVAAIESGSLAGITEDGRLFRSVDGVWVEAAVEGIDLSAAHVGVLRTDEREELLVWAAEFGRPASAGWFESVRVSLDTLEPVSSPVRFDLLPGTTLVSALRDRVVAQNAAGTVFQYDFQGARTGRLNLSFVASSIVMAAGSANAVVVGEELVALADLDREEVLQETPVRAERPTAILDEGFAVISRVGGDIELWSASDLEPIGSVVSAGSREPGGHLSIDSAGALWSHGANASTRLAIAPEEIRARSCELTDRTLTDEEWRRFVSVERPFAPVC